MGNSRGNASFGGTVAPLQVQPLVRLAATILAVHDAPPGRGAGGVQVGIGVIHRRCHASIELDNRRPCTGRRVTVHARSSIAVYAGTPIPVLTRRHVTDMRGAR